MSCFCKEYPYRGGDRTVIGPECFTDGQVISYKGENFVRQATGENDNFQQRVDDHIAEHQAIADAEGIGDGTTAFQLVTRLRDMGMEGSITLETVEDGFVLSEVHLAMYPPPVLESLYETS